jgi:hypothetical protein
VRQWTSSGDSDTIAVTMFEGAPERDWTDSLLWGFARAMFLAKGAQLVALCNLGTWPIPDTGA